MPNAIDDALARASNEQREKMLATIAEAQRNIQLVDARDDKSGAAESEIKNYESVIENAKRDMPNEVQSTMQSVDSIAPPMATPSPNQQYDSTPIELNPDTASKIESIQ